MSVRDARVDLPAETGPETALVNPFSTPSGSINATVSCGPVMSSAQAAVFGFPNPYLGIGGFAVVAATGAMLLAGGRLAGWLLAVTVLVAAVAWGF